jgi:hypothetical protein
LPIAKRAGIMPLHVRPLSTDASAAKAAERVAAAKERIARLEQGEDVPGGLGKPSDFEAILRENGFTDRDIQHGHARTDWVRRTLRPGPRCSRQFGRASAPMIPQRVHTIRGPNVGTSTSSGQGSALLMERQGVIVFRAPTPGGVSYGPNSGYIAASR